MELGHGLVSIDGEQEEVLPRRPSLPADKDIEIVHNEHSPIPASQLSAASSLTLEDLTACICKKLGNHTPREELLLILMTWLKEKIKVDAFLRDTRLLGGFADLLLMRFPRDGDSRFNDARPIPFTVREVNRFLDKWASVETCSSSTDIRRYLMAKEDINAIITQSTTGDYDTDRNQYTNNVWVEDSPKTSAPRKTGANTLPLGVKTMSRESGQETYTGDAGNYIESMGLRRLEDGHLAGPEPDGLHGSPQPKSQFSAVDKKEALDAGLSVMITDPANDIESSLSTRQERSTCRKSDPSHVKPTQTHGLILSEKERIIAEPSATMTDPAKDIRSPLPEIAPCNTPPSSYLCKRCKVPGHYLLDCPTILDISLDPPVAPDYFCKVCKRKGRHLAAMCPLNTNEDSVTMRRKRAGIILPEYRKNLSKRKRQRHRRSRSPSVHRTYERERSPVRRQRRSRVDSYRPDRWDERERAPSGSENSEKRGHRPSPIAGSLSTQSQTHSTGDKHEARGPARSPRSQHINIGGFTTAQTGRLSYDDDIFMGNKSPQSKEDLSNREPSENPSDGRQKGLLRLPIRPISKNQLQDSSSQAHSFLSRLQEVDNDFGSQATHTIKSDTPEAGRHDAKMEQDSNPSILSSHAADENESMSMKPERYPVSIIGADGNWYRRVTEPAFGCHVVALFQNRLCPIIHHYKRKTAIEVTHEAIVGGGTWEMSE